MFYHGLPCLRWVSPNGKLPMKCTIDDRWTMRLQLHRDTHLTHPKDASPLHLSAFSCQQESRVLEMGMLGLTRRVWKPVYGSASESTPEGNGEPRVGGT